jgi:hypothetical protein
VRQGLRRAVTWTASGGALLAAGYGSLVAIGWSRYGRPRPATPEQADDLLDRFMPAYEVVERHQIGIAAPADVVLRAAGEMTLQGPAIVRAIFRLRELVLGARPDTAARPTGLLAQVQSLGWAILAERPGREVVVGAVTQPWRPNVVFRAVPAEQFEAFDEPDHVKIVWTLRADPIDAGASVFRTETRVATTDAAARRKFRWYWARFSPGIALIRWMMLAPLKAEAEARALANVVRR